MSSFEHTAMEIFRHQSQHCRTYSDYVCALGIGEAKCVEELPFLPIETFRAGMVYSAENEPEKIFTSSATTEDTPSKHYVASLANYEQTFCSCWEYFYGKVEKYSFYALLPNYLEREGSSLVYMLGRMIEMGGGGFYLYDYGKLLADMERDRKPKVLFGVTYALLELAQQYALCLKNTIVMETGGMKGRRREMQKTELHHILSSAFGVSTIHSEYGMTELNSQAYSCGDGVFECPPTMRVVISDVFDPSTILNDGRVGRINIIDLANRDSCAFIATEDLGHRLGEAQFMLDGRVTHSQVRGCNLLIGNE